MSGPCSVANQYPYTPALPPPPFPYHVAMPIFLDDQRVDLDGDDLGQVLAAAGSVLGDSGRIVVEVSLNGQTIGGSEIEARGNEAVGDGELRLYSANPHDLARSTLEALMDQLDRAVGHQNEAAELIHRDEQQPAMVALGQAIDIWQQTYAAVMQTAGVLALDVQGLCVGDRAATDVLGDLAGQLGALRDAIAGADSVAVADALAYEWPQMAADWKQLLLGMIDAIDERQRTSE